MLVPKNFLFALILIAGFCLSHDTECQGQAYTVEKKFTDSEAGITCMSVNKFRNLLVYGDQKGNIIFRSLNDSSPVKITAVHGSAVNTINFNSTGDLMISSTSDGEIKIYDFRKDQIIQSIYSPDYNGIRFVIFSIADGFIYFNSGTKLYKTRSDLTQHVDLIFTFPDSLNSAVITTDRNALIIGSKGYIRVIGTRSDMINQELSMTNSSTEYMSLLGDSLLATWSSDAVIRFWPYRLAQLSTQASFWFKAGEPAPMNFSANAKLMVSGNIANWARVWNPFEKKINQELFGHDGRVSCSAFGTDEKTLFTGSADHSVIEWKYNEAINTQAPVLKKEVVPEPLTENKIQDGKDSIITPPDIIMQEENIPSVIQGRKVTGTEKFEVNSSVITIYVYDNSYFDGDTMSLFFNGEWILDHYGVTKKKKSIDLQLKANTNNFLVLFANNLGKSPPNTAAVEINEGGKHRIIRLSSDLKSCSAINFVYKTDN